MTVCPKCKGKAEYFKEVFNDGKRSRKILVECDMCHGSGEVPMTNEKWFCELPLTEKSEFMAKAFESLLDDIENGKDVSFVKTITFWDYWLNKEHKS